MKQIALVTELERPALSQSDALLVAPLREYGLEAIAVPWDAPDMEWEQYHLVVLRSCWLYHRQAERFRGWIQQLQQTGVNLWNPAPLVLWNMDKRYLRDLAERGVPVVPTVWLEPEEQVDLADVIQQQGWSDVVVKPRVSASAYGIWRTSLANAPREQAAFQVMVQKSGVMVQPVMPEIVEGEWSLVFFLGEYSHAALKKPKAGDIFVQQYLGGTSSAAAPPPFLIPQAQTAIRQAVAQAGLTGWPLYARVDGLVQGSTFVLMELELIEPGLFLGADPDAAARFASMIYHLALSSSSKFQ